MIPLRDSTYRVGTPHVTRALIVINLLIYGFTGYILNDVPTEVIVVPDNSGLTGQQQRLSEEREVYLLFGAVPEFITGELESNTLSRDAVEQQGVDLLPGLLILLTPLTAMFLHGSILHVGGNMLFLWVFGDNIEDRLGPVRFLLFYLIGGYAAAAAHIYIDTGDLVPMIGASGAVSAVLGAYLMLYPRALVQVLIPIGFLIPAVVPAVVMIGFYFLYNLIFAIDSVAGSAGGGTAWWAHLGGLVAGVLIIYPFLAGRWKEPAQEVTATWQMPTNFGFGFGARRGIPRQGRLRSDPPPAPAPDEAGSAAPDDVALPDGWRVVPPQQPAKKSRRPRFAIRRRRRGPGSVDAYRPPPENERPRD